MIKFVSIIGTRPQFIKASILSKYIPLNEMNEIIICTGQHYDNNMADIFLNNLFIRNPDYTLSANHKSVNIRLSYMIKEINDILLRENPKFVIVYGDCDTTLAGAISASNLNIPLVHIESGLRSFDKKMPEEINRIIVDNLSTLLFCPTKTAMNNIDNENILTPKYLVGDLMIDMINENLERIVKNIEVLGKFNLKKKEYSLLTIHRSSNTQLHFIFEIIEQLRNISDIILFPVHPRTKLIINSIKDMPTNLIICEPLGYIDMQTLLMNSKVLITDSGGLQKEAHEYDVNCITLRTSTEWIETLKYNNILLDDISKLYETYNNIHSRILDINMKHIYHKTSYKQIINLLKLTYIDIISS